MRVQTCTDCRAADAEDFEVVEQASVAPDMVIDDRPVGVKFLAEPHRHRVLQVRAADLDDGAEVGGLVGARAESLLEIITVLSRREQVAVTPLSLTDLLALRTVDAIVDARLSLRQAHDLAHDAEEFLLTRVDRLTAATVHVSPAGMHP